MNDLPQRDQEARRDPERLPRGQRLADHQVVGRCVDRIDRDNILNASLFAMARAVAGLSCKPRLVLVDGNKVPPKLPCLGRAIVKGDAKCLSIAAASIVAKVTRDRLMARLALRYPGYGWQTNMGYGTEEHHEAEQILRRQPHRILVVDDEPNILDVLSKLTLPREESVAPAAPTGESQGFTHPYQTARTKPHRKCPAYSSSPSGR